MASSRRRDPIFAWPVAESPVSPPPDEEEGDSSDRSISTKSTLSDSARERQRQKRRADGAAEGRASVRARAASRRAMDAGAERSNDFDGRWWKSREGPREGKSKAGEAKKGQIEKEEKHPDFRSCSSPPAFSSALQIAPRALSLSPSRVRQPVKPPAPPGLRRSFGRSSVRPSSGNSTRTHQVCGFLLFHSCETENPNPNLSYLANCNRIWSNCLCMYASFDFSFFAKIIGLYTNVPY